MYEMDRTIPSFRITLDMEWKIYQQYLDNKNNDERNYLSKCFQLQVYTILLVLIQIIPLEYILF